MPACRRSSASYRKALSGSYAASSNVQPEQFEMFVNVRPAKFPHVFAPPALMRYKAKLRALPHIAAA